MKYFILSIGMILSFILFHSRAQAQIEPDAGTWKTWFIESAEDYRLPGPPSYKDEIAEVLSRQKQLDSAGLQQIIYWNAGAPGYRWHNMMYKLWMSDTSNNGSLAYMLMGTAIYDATIAAWDTKYAYNRPRPFTVSKKIKAYITPPESPSYPCEHSVAAGVAAALISHFYPHMADSVNKLALQVSLSRVAAGVVFPTDTHAGFELGRQIAAKQIELTKNYITKAVWDGKIPEQPGLWRGKNPLAPLSGLNKPVVLDSGSRFRPAPPPDFQKDMDELKNFKQTFSSRSNAFYFASQPFWEDLLNKKIFEYNIHLNPPLAARLYAVTAVTNYDAFIACWDAKYAYWGIRPDQYDTTYRPLMPSPPFPGYPSGHAAISGAMGELYSYFFPSEAAYFRKKAKDGAESRFHAGIHFRTDNEVGLELGRNVANAVINRVKNDGADKRLILQSKK